MALMKLDPNYWFELEHGYTASLATRRALLEEHGDRILFCAPGETAALACRELLEMALQFVCRRYPQYFVIEDDLTFVNRILKTRTFLSKDILDGRRSLQILFDNIPEDFAIVLSGEDNRYHLRAAAVCSSVGWHIGQHRDRPLRDIHQGVTDYAAKMARSMDRYFARMPTDQPIQRGSWSVEEGRPLFLPDEGQRAGTSGVTTVEDLHLRCDWQTLRRLPLTGAIIFNFKTVFTQLENMRTEPFVPALLHCILQDGDPRLVTPGKCMEHVRVVVLPALKAWAEEQVEAGVVPPDWEPRTLDESPFFPGWEAKWHAVQGL